MDIVLSPGVIADIELYPQLQNIQCFVICGGKCGSSTLYQTLKMNGLKTLHAHSDDEFRQRFSRRVSFSLYDVLRYNYIKYPSRTLYIIDSYRTPIERRISSFFQNIDAHTRIKNPSVETCLEIFDTQDFLYRLETYHSINDVLSHFGLPLFSEFDFHKKWVEQVAFDRVRFLKIRFNDISHWESILSEIFQRSIVLKNENISSDKQYSMLYTSFKAKYRVPQSFLSSISTQDSEWDVFVSPEEKQKYLSDWQNKTR